MTLQHHTLTNLNNDTQLILFYMDTQNAIQIYKKEYVVYYLRYFVTNFSVTVKTKK